MVSGKIFDRRYFVILFVSASLAVVTIISVIIGVTIHIKSQCFDYDRDPPKNLTFSSSAEETVLSWLSPENAESYSIGFLIIYHIDFGESTSIITSNLYYAFLKVDACTRFYVSLGPLNEAGEISFPMARCTYTVPAPTNITAVTNFNYSIIQEQETLMFWWERPAEVAKCRIINHVLINTDISTKPIITTLLHDWIQLSQYDYCFSASIQVIPSVISESMDGWDGDTASLEYKEELEAPQDLKLTPSYVDNTLTASWKGHRNPGICKIKYFVKYQVEGRVTRSTHTTAATSIIFNIPYCAKAIVSVAATSTMASQSPTSIVESEQGLPIYVRPVDSVNITLIDKMSAEVSWNPPEFVYHCDSIEYTVEAVNNESNATSSCSGMSSCTITLTTFCPKTTFTIQPKQLQGDVATYIFSDCDGNTS